MLLRINPDNLNKSQTSLAKNILLSNRFIIEEKDANLDINISKTKFECEFLNNQKVFLTQYSHSVAASQTITS